MKGAVGGDAPFQLATNLVKGLQVPTFCADCIIANLSGRQKATLTTDFIQENASIELQYDIVVEEKAEKYGIYDYPCEWKYTISA